MKVSTLTHQLQPRYRGMWGHREEPGKSTGSEWDRWGPPSSGPLPVMT